MVGGRIIKNWDEEDHPSLFRKVGDKMHRGLPLKERVSQAVWRLKMQSQKLEESAMKMQRHDRELFEKCVSAEVAKDSARASIYANECVEVRKMAKLILQSQLALEQVALRLETVQEFGDVITEISPVSGVVHTLKGKLSGVIPEVSYELGSIGDMLNGMMVEAGESTITSSSIGTTGEESKRILGEAGMVAEQRMKNRFPEISSSRRSALEKEASY